MREERFVQTKKNFQSKLTFYSGKRFHDQFSQLENVSKIHSKVFDGGVKTEKSRMEI